MTSSSRTRSVLSSVLGAAACAVCLSAQAGKVLMIDSYHEGYLWSDGIVKGATSTLAGKAEVKVMRMDTKRNTSEEFKTAAAVKVKAEIETWKPDVVIAADDNSVKYVVVPFLKGGPTPVVFCGLNWDASVYGLPCDNVTGMLEHSLATQLFAAMGRFSKGKRIGFLGKDNETDHKEAAEMTKRFNVTFTERFVNTFDEWKKAYAELQNEVDMLTVVNNAGITGWSDAEAKAFVLANTKVPSGTCQDHVAPFVLITYGKVAAEQGEWAAGAAIQIMGGKSPKDIPVAINQKGQFFVNMPLATKMGVKFPLDMLKAATVIKE